MTDADVVKTYSNEALQGVIRQLSASGGWWPRLEAARIELSRRKANQKTRKL